MNIDEEVHSRRLTAVLAEAAGDGVPTDLEERVLQRVRSVSSPRDRFSAVTLLAGMVVVGLVAWTRSTSSGSRTTSQDAQIVAVTTASLQDAMASVAPCPEGSAAERIVAIADAASVTVVIAEGADTESRVNLTGATWREAIDRIAAECQVGVTEVGGALVVGRGARADPARSRVTLRTEAVELEELVKRLHVTCGANVLLAGGVAGRVRVDVVDVPWRVLLESTVARLGFHAVGSGNVVAIAAMPRPRGVPPRSSNVGGSVVQPAQNAFDMFARVVMANVVVDPRVSGSVAYFAAASTPIRSWLSALAIGVDSDVREHDGGIFQVSRAKRADAGIALTAENLSLRELVQMSWTTLQPNVEIADGVDAKVTVFVSGVPWFDVLRAAAVASGLQFLRTENGYRIE